MSGIRGLYQALAAMPVPFTKEGGGTSTPTAKDLPYLPKSVETADLPVRVLLPTEEWSGEGTTLMLLSAGTAYGSGEMTWRVTDLLLWEAVGQGRGLLDFLADLVRYSGAYVDAVLANREPTSGFRLDTLTVRPGVFEFPLGSGRAYFGVECLGVYTELLNP